MSTLTRDPLAGPPLRRPASKAAARWEWPDPASATAPPMPPREVPRRPVAPLWPDEPSVAFLPAADLAPPLPAAAPVPAAAPAPGNASLPDVDLFAPVPPTAESLARAPMPASSQPPWPQSAPPEPVRQFDPSPSRLSYRLNRLWLTPLVRHLVRIGLPLAFCLAFAGGWLASADNRASLGQALGALVSTVQNQPVFQVHSLQVLTATPEVAQAVAATLDLRFPVSSFDLDLTALRAQVQAFDAVEQAWLQVRSGGVLEVRIQERTPAMVWRHAGGLELIDATGHRVALLANRSARADLPLILGEGADRAVAEAQLLWAVALPLQPRLRGLVRVGERRWDLVLDRDQRIVLPELGALGALERVLALDAAQQLLSRDLRVVDMRISTRPTIRLTDGAMAEVTRNRPTLTGARSR